MSYDPYVIYQSMEAANAIMLAQELLPYNHFNFSSIHYINDETAAANLDLAQQLAVIRHTKE